jgi:uncharacterized membrane protein
MSRPPEYPGGPQEPWGPNPNPGGYPPPGYGPPAGPPPGPPPGYGPPPGAPPGYGAPPPPPPSGYGTPPAPPGYGQPPGGYPQYPGAAAPFSVGDAFKWALNKFGKYGAELIVPVLVYAVAMAVLGIVEFLIAMGFGVLDIGAMGSSTENSDSSSAAGGVGFFGFLVVSALLAFFFVAAFLYIQAAYLSGCLDIADGKPVTIGSFLRPRNFGTVIVTALLIAVGTAIGIFLCIIPGIIFAFLTMFAIAFVVDRSLSATDAVKASISTVRSNVGNALLAYLVEQLALWVGGLVLYVGLLVAGPIAALIHTYTYRRLSGGQVAPLT